MNRAEGGMRQLNEVQQQQVAIVYAFGAHALAAELPAPAAAPPRAIVQNNSLFSLPTSNTQNGRKDHGESS